MAERSRSFTASSQTGKPSLRPERTRDGGARLGGPVPSRRASFASSTWNGSRQRYAAPGVRDSRVRSICQQSPIFRQAAAPFLRRSHRMAISRSSSTSSYLRRSFSRSTSRRRKRSVWVPVPWRLLPLPVRSKALSRSRRYARTHLPTIVGRISYRRAPPSGCPPRAPPEPLVT